MVKSRRIKSISATPGAILEGILGKGVDPIGIDLDLDAVLAGFVASQVIEGRLPEATIGRAPQHMQIIWRLGLRLRFL